MNKFKLFVHLFFWVTLSCKTVGAQSFEVPKPTTLQKAGDYDQHRETFLQAVDWLLKKDIDAPGRDKVNAFGLAWISGSSDFTITLERYILDLTDTNPDLMMVFLGRWGQFAIQHPAEKDNAYQCNFLATNALLDFYESSPKVKKDKDVDKLIKLREKEKLQVWLQKQMSSEGN